MTRASLREYAAVQGERYRQATRAEKRQLLDEVVAVTGIHRKAAIRLLRRLPRPRSRPGPAAVRAPTGRRSPPPRRCYGRPVAGSGRIGCTPSCRNCSTGCSAVASSPCPPAVEKLVRQASRPTLARLLGAGRAQYPPRGATITRPGPVLRHEIPIRTFTDWDDARPGFLRDRSGRPLWLEHGGLLPLYALRGGHHDRVDRAGPGLGQESRAGGERGASRAGALAGAPHGARQRQRQRVHQPPPAGLVSRHRITFTRSRAWKKNDSAHVEQKNGAIVRHLIGYDRFVSKAAFTQLQRVYDLVRLHINFFQPVEKLVSKTRQGARTHRVYDCARTPYQRLCAAGVLTPGKHDELERLYQTLNPLQLRRDLDAALARLWALAAPDPHRHPGDIAPPPLRPRPGGS